MPFKALDGLVEHFMRFEAEDRELPSIWHQSLLMFIQRYKKDIKEEDLGDIRRLIKKHRHHLITDEIYKEIDTVIARRIRTLLYNECFLGSQKRKSRRKRRRFRRNEP